MKLIEVNKAITRSEGWLLAIIGYHRWNSARSCPSSTRTRTCSSSCAERGAQSICWDLDILLSMIWLTADSAKALEILKPARRR